jgi:hypothetical protein
MTRARSRRLSFVLAAVAVAVAGLAVGTVLLAALRQGAATRRLRALGAVVTYDFELPPEWRKARSLHELGMKLEGITDRRDLPDPDHDGRAWLRRQLGPALLHDVVSVNLVYNYGAENAGRRETPGDYHQDLALLADLRELRQLLLHRGQACDRALEHIRGLRRLESLYLWDAEVTDRGMENLRPLGRLRYLHLSDAGVTDAGLAWLAGLGDLETLSMQGNGFTDAGLVHLRGLTRLRSLWLCATGDGTSRISGTGLEHLAGLTDLEELALQGTGFADAGVEHLRPFRKLRALYLGKSALTPEGKERLEEVIPSGCRVHVAPP